MKKSLPFLLAVMAFGASSDVSTHKAQAADAKTKNAAVPQGKKASELKNEKETKTTISLDSSATTTGVDDFESGVINWTAFKSVRGEFNQDAAARVETTEKASLVRGGKRSLSYIYEAAPQTFSLLARLGPGDLSAMRGVRFSVRCDAPTVVAFALTEKGGARYQTGFYVPENKWQNVAFDFDEMELAQETTDSNGTLDLDEIQNYAIADIASLWMKSGSGQEGDRILLLDDFAFTSKPLQDASTRKTSSLLIDDFSSPAVRWLPTLIELKPSLKIGITDADIKAEGKENRALVMKYERRKNQVMALMRSLENRKIPSSDALQLKMQTAQDGHYMISLQEKDGSRYEKIVELKSADKLKELSVPISEFKLSDGSKDENTRLDFGQLQEVSIGDITIVLSEILGTPAPEGDNTLRLSEIKFVRLP